MTSSTGVEVACGGLMWECCQCGSVDRFFTFDNHLASYSGADIHLTFVRADIIAYLGSIVAMVHGKF